MAKRYTHIELLPSGRANPQRTRMICEAPGCTNEFLLHDSYSAVALFYALTGPDVRYTSQCPEEQHFACSPDCLRACLLNCFDHHLMPLHAAKLAEAKKEVEG